MSKELKTGIIAVIIIVIFIWGFNFLKGQNLLDSGMRVFKVEYERIGGLSKASPVTINGLKVGKVDKIEFNESEEKRGQLIVTFHVENDFEFSKNSVVKIYSPNPLSGSSLAIIPNYDGKIAVSGDTLIGKMEESLFTSIGERLDPLQQKIETVLTSADTLFIGLNKLLNKKTIKEVNSSVTDVNEIIHTLKETVTSVNNLVKSNQENLQKTITNTKNITDKFSKVSDSLSNINFNEIVLKAEEAVANFNTLAKKINDGEGTLGKFINDKKMYDNLEAATKELEALLKDIKLNPKRYVQFSIFGKKTKPYQEEMKN